MAKGSFSKVLDGRKAPIRGLQERNGRFYARIKIAAPDGVSRVCRPPSSPSKTPNAALNS